MPLHSEALTTYQRCAAQRAQMTAEDGRQLFEECQKVTQKITRSVDVQWMVSRKPLNRATVCSLLTKQMSSGLVNDAFAPL